MILANQRLALPGWVPVLGQDFTEVEAELSSAQAVTPGQGQTVNVAGVEVGEISARAARGRQGDRDAQARGGQRPGLPRRERAAAAQDRPEGHGRRAHARARRRPASSPPGERIPIGQTLPDVNLDEILAVARRRHAHLPAAAAVRRRRGAAAATARALANTIRRFEPTARDTAQIAEQLATRRREHPARVIHNFSLRGRGARRQGRPAGRVRRELERGLRGARAPGREPARDAAGAAVDADRDAARSARPRRSRDVLGPTLEALRPGARALGPALAQTRPFLTRDDAGHPRRDPAVRARLAPAGRRAATGR